MESARRCAGSSLTHFRVLVLNATYEPIRIVSWQKAFLLWFQDKADIVVSHEAWANSASESFAIPAVLKMRAYIKPRTRQTVRLSRDNIFLRDQHTCQYCCKKFPVKELTLDHVFPVSRGGGKTWENLTTACHKCNHKKGNRTPEEAAMPLLTAPVKLKWMPSLDVHIKRDNVDELWIPYLDMFRSASF